MENWYVVLTQTGVESVWADKQSATDWLEILQRLNRISEDAIVVPFDRDDDAHCMAASFSPQLHQA